MDEVRALMDLGLDSALPIMKAVGVRELAAHLSGDLALPEAVAAAQRATRRYVKRQTTWFRHQMAGARVVNAQYSESITSEIFSIIRPFMLTCPI